MNSISLSNISNFPFSEMNPSSFESRSSVSTSVKEPKEMYRKCINSFCEFLAEPSEMLVGTETDALRNCDIKPNFSSEGNESVIKYISFTKEKLFFQTSKL